MKIEDKKLYLNSSMIGELVFIFIFLCISLVLYFFYGAKDSILYFSVFALIMTVFSTFEIIRNVKYRIFAVSTFYTTFKSKNLVLLWLFLFYLIGVYFLYDYEYNKKNLGLILNLSFILFGIGAMETLVGYTWNFIKFCRTYNTKPYFHCYKKNELNKKFSNKAIYIVKYDYYPEILHAYENYFTVKVQNGYEYVDYERGREYIYYKGQELIPSQLEKYMIANDKTFAEMTDNDIVLMRMQNI